VGGARVRQLAERVAAERRCFDDVVPVGPRVVHGETVVVLGREDHIAHSGAPGEAHPGVRVEAIGD
jgi:hypothetical protein